MSIEMTNLWDHAGRIGDTLAVVGPAAYWIMRHLRKIINAATFTGDVATKHLPHIYSRLRGHDEMLGIVPPDHPDIVWRNGNGSPH